MMGMIKKDLFMMKNNFKTFLITFALFILYSFLFDMDMTFMFPLMALMISISTLNYDDFNHWHAYAVTLPQGKINVVKSKYVVTIVCTFIVTVISVLLGIGIGHYKGNLNMEETISSAFGVLVALYFMMSVLYPIMFKYGAEKGRMAMGIIGLSIVGIVVIFTKLVHVEVSKDFMVLLETYLPAILVIVIAIIIGISYHISKKIYAKKEF